MIIVIHTVGGKIICTINNADDETPKDVIDYIDERYEHLRQSSMTLITKSAGLIREYTESFSTIFPDLEPEYVVELTLYSTNKISHVKEIDRIFRNIIQITYLNKCESHERIMHEIVSNVSYDGTNAVDDYIVTGSNILEQFNMLNEESSLWSISEHCEDVVKVRSVIDLIKNFMMTEKMFILMVNKLLDVAYFRIGIIIIKELRDHTFAIEPDEHDKNNEDIIKPDGQDENNTDLKTMKLFRKSIVNEAQKKFTFLLMNISTAPYTMFSLIIVLSRLFVFRFISQIILAKICSDLIDKVNDSNITFVISYFNIILKICTPRLFETDNGRELRYEISVEKKKLIAMREAKKNSDT
jgi:hypothetical protein